MPQNRRLVHGEPLRSKLVLNTMERAVGQRRPKDVIHQSDQDSQHTPLASGKSCGRTGVRSPMASVGTPATTPWWTASFPAWAIVTNSGDGNFYSSSRVTHGRF